mgnify:CR=1 FL=1
MSTNSELFFSMLKNIHSYRMNRDMIGHTIKRDLTLSREDVDAYVEATNDNPERYEKSDCPLPGFFTSKFLYPLYHYFLTHPDLHVNLLKMVHGEQEAVFHKPLTIGSGIDTEMFIKDIEDSPAGECLIIGTRGYSLGAIAQEGTSTFIVRKGSAGKKAGTHDIMGDKPAELFRTSFKTEKGQQMKYARVSGDRNFMHTSPFLAKLSGLPGVIMHGICIQAMTFNTLMDKLAKGKIERVRGISVRFARPVLPGEEVTLICYRSDRRGTVFFEGVNSEGKLVLKKGIFHYEE